MYYCTITIEHCRTPVRWLWLRPDRGFRVYAVDRPPRGFGFRVSDYGFRVEIFSKPETPFFRVPLIYVKVPIWGFGFSIAAWIVSYR